MARQLQRPPSRAGRGSRRQRPLKSAPLVEITIESLGGRGDGLGTHQGQTVCLPLTLPEERVLARLGGRQGGMLTGEVVELLAPSPFRRTPPCPHFGPCGGCSLQHLAPPSYRNWKRDRVARALYGAEPGLKEALEQATKTDGEAPPLPSPAASLMAPLVEAAPGQRRRVGFSVQKSGRRIFAGFAERASNRVVDLGACPVAAEPLVALLEPLRGIGTTLLGDGARLLADATLTDSGVDLLLGLEKEPPASAWPALAQFAEAHDLARLSLRWPGGGAPMPVVARRPVRIQMGLVAVPLPPGAFLQATAEGAAALTAMAVEAARQAAARAPLKRIADLFAGCGSFSFPLAEIAPVLAVESDTEALAALQAGAAASGRTSRIETRCRDLMQAPLMAEELAGFDLVLFDPPRAGALAQAEQLAASRVPIVVAISCNPATLARDMRILVAGGYALQRVVPVDQFLWSGHVEGACVLTKA